MVSKHSQIMHVNGDKLPKLMIEFSVGVAITNTFAVKEIDFISPKHYERR